MKLEDHLNKIIDDLIFFAPKFVVALLVLVFGLWIIKRIAALAQKGFEKRNLDVSLRTFLKSLISIGLKIVLIVTVAGMLGIGTASFVTILGAAGLAVGLALQGSLSNFAGGVLLMIFKPYRVGDTIEAQGQSGEVKEIQIFNTIVVTADQKTVIFPNGILSNGTIINHTRQGKLRADIVISVSLENDIEKVKTIIKEILEANISVLKEPAPLITIGKIENGAAIIHVKPFCLPDHVAPMASEINEAIKINFAKKNIIWPVTYSVVKSVN